jgi:hypothetical protein
VKFAVREFGQPWHGYGRVQAIRDWVIPHTRFAQNASDSNTSAIASTVRSLGDDHDEGLRSPG